MINFFPVMVIFTLVNFGWQAVQIHPDWHVALERSFFQAFALGFFWAKSAFQS